MKILVTGCAGQIGTELYKLSTKSKKEWVFLDSKEFNLLDQKNIYPKLEKIKPDLVINCAAYTDVDNAENNILDVDIINNISVGIISKWTGKNNCKLIHISTDYVFDGTARNPISEDVLPNPINYYGYSKMLSEVSCISNNKNSIIIRSSLIYSNSENNFVSQIMKLARDNKRFFVVNDQVSSPTFAGDLAEAIFKIFNHPKWVPGIYNYTNMGQISRFELAKEILSIIGSKCVIEPISSKKYKSIAKRPLYSTLDSLKIKRTFDLELVNFETSLKSFLKKNQ